MKKLTARIAGALACGLTLSISVVALGLARGASAATATTAGQPSAPMEMVDAKTDSIMYKATLQSIIDCYTYASLQKFQMSDYIDFAGDPDGASASVYTPEEINHDVANGGSYHLNNQSDLQVTNENGFSYYTLGGVRRSSDEWFASSNVTPVISSDPSQIVYHGGYTIGYFDLCPNDGTAVENRGRVVTRRLCFANGSNGNLYAGESFPVPSIVSGLVYTPDPNALYSKDITPANYGFYGITNTIRDGELISQISNGVARYPQMMAPPLNLAGAKQDGSDEKIEYDTTYLCQDFFWHKEQGARSGDDGFWGILNPEKYGASVLNESAGEIPNRDYGDLLVSAKFLEKMGYVYEPGDSSKQCIRFMFTRQTYVLYGAGLFDGGRRYEHEGEDKTLSSDWLCVTVGASSSNSAAKIVSAPTVEEYGDDSDGALPSGLITFETLSEKEGGGVKVTCDDGEKYALGSGFREITTGCHGSEVYLALGDSGSIDNAETTMSALVSAIDQQFGGFEVAADGFGNWFNNNGHMLNLAHNGDKEYLYVYNGTEPITESNVAQYGGSGTIQLGGAVQEEDMALVTGSFGQLLGSPKLAATVAIGNILAGVDQYAAESSVTMVDNTLTPAEKYILYRKYLLKYYNFDNTMFCEPLTSGSAESNEVATDMLDVGRPSAGAPQSDWDEYYAELVDRGVRKDIAKVNPDGSIDENTRIVYWDVVCRDDSGNVENGKVMTDNGCVDKSQIPGFSDSVEEGEYGRYEMISLYVDNEHDGEVAGNEVITGFRRCYFDMRNGSVMLDRYAYGVSPDAANGFKFFTAVTIDDIIKDLVAPTYLSGVSGKVDPENDSAAVSAIMDGHGDFALSMIDSVEDTDGIKRAASCWHGAAAAGVPDSDGAGFLGWFVCPIIDKLGAAVRTLYEQIVVHFIQVDTSLINGSSNGTRTSVSEAWGKILIVANAVLTIFFLIMLVSQMTGYGMNQYGIKALLPRLIIGAILVNLSFLVCQLCMDIATITGGVIKNALIDIVNNTAEGLFGTANMSFPVEDTDGLSVGGTLAFVGIVAVLITAIILSKGAIFIPIAIGLIGVVFAVFALLLVLAMRYALIIMLIIISPLAFACALLPNTKKFFNWWFNLFKGALIVYPVCNALVYGADAAAKLVLFTWMGNGQNLQSDISFSDAMMLVSVAVMDVAPIFMLSSAVKKCMGGMSGAIGKIGALTAGVGAMARSGSRKVLNRSALGRGAQLYRQRRQDSYRSKLTRRNANVARHNQALSTNLAAASNAMSQSRVGRGLKKVAEAPGVRSVNSAFRLAGNAVAFVATGQTAQQRADLKQERKFNDQRDINKLAAMEAKNAKAYKDYRKGKPRTTSVGGKDAAQTYFESAFGQNAQSMTTSEEGKFKPLAPAAALLGGGSRYNQGAALAGLDMLAETGKPSLMLDSFDAAMTTGNMQNLDARQTRSLGARMRSVSNGGVVGNLYGFRLQASADAMNADPSAHAVGFSDYMLSKNGFERDVSGMSANALARADDDEVEWLATHGVSKEKDENGKPVGIAKGKDAERSFLSMCSNEQFGGLILNGSPKHLAAVGDMRKNFGNDRMKAIAKTYSINQISRMGAEQLDMFADKSNPNAVDDSLLREALQPQLDKLKENQKLLNEMNADVKARLGLSDNPSRSDGQSGNA